MSEELRARAAEKNERFKRALAHPLVTLVIFASVLGSLLMGLSNSVDNGKLIDCLKRYNEQSSTVTRDRAQIADQDRALTTTLETLDQQDKAALNDLVASFRDAAGNLSAQRAAQSKYLDVVSANNIRRQEIYKQQTENERERAERVFPAPPSLACD